MEIGEEVAALEQFIDDNPHCDGIDEPDNAGKCRIGDPGKPGDLSTPTPEQLYKNMVDAEVELPSDPPRKEGLWDLYQCNSSSHPFQSHHLIPKKHLPKKDVCVWLAVNFKSQQWKLKASTNYDTDHARNGMALPFASTTYQWSKANTPEKKTNLCDWMMHLTSKQLHQGSHTYKEYDRGEEEALHANEQPGYLGAVDELLDTVHGEMLTHVQVCDYCKSKEPAKPIKVRPLQSVVEHMYQVSMLMGQIITKRKKFVSARAAAHTIPSVRLVP